MGHVVKVPLRNLSWFEEKIKKLYKKLTKETMPSYFMAPIGFHYQEDKTKPFYDEKIMEVAIQFPEPEINGWKFVASLEHTDHGNVINNITKHTLDEKYKTSKVCDHCNINRFRNNTYILFHEEYGYKQVGSSCLKDFLNVKNVDDFVKIANMVSLVYGYEKEGYDADYSFSKPYYDVDTVLKMATSFTKLFGYHKANYTDSTVDRVIRSYYSNNEAKLYVEDTYISDMKEYVMTLDNSSDYVHNCQTIIKNGYTMGKNLGILCSIPNMYIKHLQKKIEINDSNHVGNIGDKIEVEVTVIKSIVTNFGYMNRMIDDSGNVIIWFSSKNVFGDYVNNKITIFGTVKKHDTYNGKKQTYMTRCKIRQNMY